jgi:solute carrier family 8 (sodium/calcium exchanger)
VPSGNLGFSVAVFTAVAITTLVTLMIKRRLIGGELGGKGIYKNGVAAFFCSLWFIYILLSSLNVYGHI